MVLKYLFLKVAKLHTLHILYLMVCSLCVACWLQHVSCLHICVCVYVCIVVCIQYVYSCILLKVLELGVGRLQDESTVSGCVSECVCQCCVVVHPKPR